MALFRWIVGMPAAALITAALFFMMAELIKNKDVVIDERERLEIPAVIAKIKDTDPNGPKPPTTTIPKEIPPTELDFSKRDSAPKGPIVPVGPVKIDPKPPGPQGQFDGAVIRTTPMYPEGCRSRGAQGIVIVQFDITPEGNVTNVQVIETPDSCFVRPIIKAVSGWKYPPVGSGSAMRYGKVETFNFQLLE